YQMSAMFFKKILIINIFGIGDVLFSTPLIRSIKESFPESFVGFVCNKRAYDVLKDNPCVDKLFIYEKDDFRALYKTSKKQSIQKAVQDLSDIKKEKFDVVIDLSLNKYASFLMWALGIKTRIGFNYKNRSPFLTHKVNIDGYENKHVVEHYLGLLEPLGAKKIHRQMEVGIAPQDRQWAEDVLGKHQIKSDDLLVAMVPGGGVSWGKDVAYRRWPPQQHARLADKVIEKFHAKIILLGDLSEEEIGQRMVQAMQQRVVSLIGKTTVGQYLALLAKCKRVIVNDGGPLHMAVAAGAKTVSLIGPVDENVYGPYPEEGHVVVTADVACRPCYRQFRRAQCDHIRCLKDITVDAVLDRIKF
ncbi:MAG: glycosyltransferase family 9 protein, partial [Candidatus Omnitrophica bacterium]|nr:glycosyltransferase family 9 protein [Candidatus Omnitrophota bacterium]